MPSGRLGSQSHRLLAERQPPQMGTYQFPEQPRNRTSCMHLKQAKEAPKLHYLLGRPSLTENVRHYGRAKDILNSCEGITLIEEDEAADFGRDLENRVLSMGYE